MDHAEELRSGQQIASRIEQGVKCMFDRCASVVGITVGRPCLWPNSARALSPVAKETPMYTRVNPREDTIVTRHYMF